MNLVLLASILAFILLTKMQIKVILGNKKEKESDNFLGKKVVIKNLPEVGILKISGSSESSYFAYFDSDNDLGLIEIKKNEVERLEIV